MKFVLHARKVSVCRQSLLCLTAHACVAWLKTSSIVALFISWNIERRRPDTETSVLRATARAQ